MSSDSMAGSEFAADSQSGDRTRSERGDSDGRLALIQAAIRVVARGNFRKLTYRAVAAEAGVTHGLVRHHFGSMDNLIEEALHYCTDTDPARPTTQTWGDLKGFVSAAFELLETDIDIQVFQYEVMLESRRNPALRPYVARLLDQYRLRIAEGLHSVGYAHDPQTVEFFYAVLEGATLQKTIEQRATVSDYAVTALTEYLSTVASEDDCKGLL